MINYVIFFSPVEDQSAFNWEAYSAITTSLVSFITLCTIVWQIKIQQKQKKIAKQQADLQRCSFVYDCFIREKQEKLIELRRLYIEFKDKCLYLLETIFPSSISPADLRPGEFPVLKIDDPTLKAYYNKNIYDECAETFLGNGQKSSARLLKFLKENEVFLKDNPVLIEDLKTVSEAFHDFFVSINADAEKKQTLIVLGKFIDHIGKGSCHIDNQTRQNAIINMRFNFYNFIHYKMVLRRENTVEWMLSMPKNSIFRNLKMPHTPENIQEWSKNEFIAFHTLSIFHSWFNEIWLKYIDDFFYTSFDDIRKVVKNDIEQL